MTLNDLFDAATALGKLTVAGILSFDVIAAGWIIVAFTREWVVPGRALRRSEARADKNFQLAEDATDQFERALDVIERMQDRRRATDAVPPP